MEVKEMKTYRVYYKDNNECEYIKADTRGKAKYKSEMYADGDFTDLVAIRVKELDKYIQIIDTVLAKEGF